MFKKIKKDNNEKENGDLKKFSGRNKSWIDYYRQQYEMRDSSNGEKKNNANIILAGSLHSSKETLKTL